MQRQLIAVRNVYREAGIRGVVMRATAALRRPSTVFSSSPSIVAKARYLARLTSYVRQPEAPQDLLSPLNMKQLKIVWVIPDFRPGAGGHMTIFRLASHLANFGHSVSFVIQNPTVHRSAEHARSTITEHFLRFDGEVFLMDRQPPILSGDALIATDRFTCFAVEAMANFRRKFYLVQDLEPLFYPMGSEALLAESTYQMDFDCLCAGNWLRNKMLEKSRWAAAWDLAFDKSCYFPSQAVGRSDNAIAFYSRHATSRRAVELGMMALDILHARGLKFSVDFFGQKLGKLPVGYGYRDHGVLDARQLGDLYRRSTIGLVFSSTNYSLVNREMMACGLPVIDLDVESVRANFAPDVLEFARPTPSGIAEAIERLLNEKGRRKQLSDAAFSGVSALSWEQTARDIEQAIVDRLAFYAAL